MTADRLSDSFGPYAFTLAPAEAEAAAARAGLRTALKGGLLASHVAPLTAFALVMAFASVLALTGLISRRAGEATIILAAAAFMIQRLASHWRIRARPPAAGQAAIGRLRSASAVTATFGDETLSFDVDGRTLSLRYADCEQAEDAGGLIYVWPRTARRSSCRRARSPDAEEAARLVSRLSAGSGMSAERLSRADAPFYCGVESGASAGVSAAFRRVGGVGGAVRSDAKCTSSRRGGSGDRRSLSDRAQTRRSPSAARAQAPGRQDAAISGRSWRRRSSRRASG